MMMQYFVGMLASAFYSEIGISSDSTIAAYWEAMEPAGATSAFRIFFTDNAQHVEKTFGRYTRGFTMRLQI